ncbi:MAG: Unknown protein [uncultured Thiotrichaceae bacterium]|uniref:Glycine zipper domain-containing protein n=1 Tax=uncultured Thiotrichaceae bacterium TaxID=298394 RepID=A0A6S6SV48_9GAMM|nr:MAG: Unknown protein [uncultured Thiotrichaceae bacterium]
MKLRMTIALLVSTYMLQGCSAQQVASAAVGTAKLPVKAAGAVGRTAGSVAGGAIGGVVGGSIGRKVGSAVGGAVGGAAATKGL